MMLILAAAYYKISVTYSQPTLCIIKCIITEEILNPPLSELEKRDINTLFKEFGEVIDVQNKAYALSDCCEQFERYLEKSDHEGTLFSNSEKKSTLMIQTVIAQRVKYYFSQDSNPQPLSS